VHGWEFAAAVNLVPQDVKAEATIFIPQKVSRVRGMIVAIQYGLGFQVLDARSWPKLAESIDFALVRVKFSNVTPTVVDKGLRATTPDGVTNALLSLLPRLAEESGHKELTSAPLLFWGHSAAGGAAETFANKFPDRILASVLYHSAGGGGTPIKAATQIPTLIINGGKDTTVPPNGPEDFWKRGRTVGAPWTFVVEPDATHGDLTKNAPDLMVAWIKAVARQRLALEGTTLRAITEAGWIGDHRTGETAPAAAFTGSKTDASWLPEEATAREWRKVLGKQDK
jgi:dienelactone hydrolase